MINEGQDPRHGNASKSGRILYMGVDFMEESYFLRHLLATLKYRCTLAITNVPEDYPTFDIGEGVKKPIEILFHISQVLRYAQSVFNQDIKFDIALKSWDGEVEQFYKEVELLDKYISEGLPDRERIMEKLLQGPISDALTHVGQLLMLRRLAGDPIRGKNYFKADIKVE